ncbi:MAG: HEAT repeat domain-containing protein [Chloroflexi bacterium]|nr:MAG: HEAT repeat domain-containing protein [Chloroflexota bacterium]
MNPGSLIIFVVSLILVIALSYYVDKIIKKRKQERQVRERYILESQIQIDKAIDTKDTITLLKYLADPEFRDKVGNAIVEFGESAFDTLIVELDTPARAISPRLLTEVLVHIGPTAIERAKSALHHNNQNIRVSAISALGRIGDSSVVGSLIPFIDSTNLEEQTSAITSLGELQVTKVTILDKIIAKLNHQDPYVRVAAVQALENISDPRALPELERLARSDTTYVGHVQTVGHFAVRAIDKIRKDKVN